MKKWLASICLIVSPALSVPLELVKDGSFELAPSPKTIANIEDHAGAYVWVIPNGKGQLPDWDVSGRVQLSFFKGGPRLANLMGKGTISQTLATEPGKWYHLTFRFVADAEGGPQQAMLVRAGSTNRSFATGTVGSLPFQAKAPTTEIAFTGKSSGRGPFLSRIRCVSFNPEVIKIQGQLGDIYKDMDRGEKNESDLPKLLSHLTEDYVYKAVEGASLDLAGFEQLVRQRIERKYKVNTAIEDATLNEDGSLAVEVERREQKPGDYGKLETSSPRFKHTWVKIGSQWKLKSAEELAPEQ